MIDKQSTMAETRWGLLLGRYRNDAAFNEVVQIIFRAMIASNFTPQEMRDATYLATIKFLRERAEPFPFPAEAPKEPTP